MYQYYNHRLWEINEVKFFLGLKEIPAVVQITYTN